MAKKVTITLDDDILAFTERQVVALENKANHSVYINTVLAAYLCTVLEAETIVVKENTNNPEDRAEVAAWDYVAGNGF